MIPGDNMLAGLRKTINTSYILHDQSLFIIINSEDSFTPQAELG